MNGPSKSDKQGIDWLECGIVFAGALVVAGLVMESGPEISTAISEGRFPKLTVTGGVIVAFGVLLEVVLGIFITQRANRAQSEANERVARAEQATAEAVERAAKAEEKIAELQFLTEREAAARVKMQSTMLRLTVTRVLSAEEERDAVEVLRKFAGQRFTVRLAASLKEEDEMQDRNWEQHFFADQLRRIGHSAGWEEERVWNMSVPAARKGVKVIAEISSRQPAEALSVLLSKAQVSCALSLVRDWDLLTPLVISVGLL